MSMRDGKQADKESGVLYLEMALTLPIYLFVVMFMIDVIRVGYTAAMVQYSADNAAFCGARVHLTLADSPRFAQGRSSAEMRKPGNGAAYRASLCTENFPDNQTLDEPGGYLGYALKNLNTFGLAAGREVRITMESPLFEVNGNGVCIYTEDVDGAISLESQSGPEGATVSKSHASITDLPLCAGGDGGLGVLTVGVRYVTLMEGFFARMGVPRPPFWINGYGIARNEGPYV